MVKYSIQEDALPQQSAKARGSHLRVHFKHCREVTTTIRGMKLTKAKAFLQDVLEYKQIVPFTKFTGGVGRHAQAKNMNAPGSKGRWPQKASKIILDLLTNAEANAEVQGLDTDQLYVTHTQCNRAPPGRRRTYRAHGRINAYMSQPAHIEIVLGATPEPVAKAEDPEAGKKNLSRKRRAQLRLKAGGGVTA